MIDMSTAGFEGPPANMPKQPRTAVLPNQPGQCLQLLLALVVDHDQPPLPTTPTPTTPTPLKATFTTLTHLMSLRSVRSPTYSSTMNMLSRTSASEPCAKQPRPRKRVRLLLWECKERR